MRNGGSDESGYFKLVSFIQNHFSEPDWKTLIETLDEQSESVKDRESLEVSNKLWNQFVFVFCQQFIQQSQNFYPNDRPQIKYKMFKQLFELLKCFYSKFRIFKAQNKLLIDGSQPGENVLVEYVSQLKEFSSQINVMGIIAEAFEVKIYTHQPLNS